MNDQAESAIVAIAEQSFLSVFIGIPSRERKLVVMALSSLMCLFCWLLCKVRTLSRHMLQLESKQDELGDLEKMKWLDEASYGITSGLCQADRERLVAWVSKRCEGQRERIELLGRLYWYRSICTKANYVEASDDSCHLISANSWRDMALWARDCFPFPTWRQTLSIFDVALPHIITALGECHQADFLWPACAVDALLLSVFDNIIIDKDKQSQVVVSREALVCYRGQLVLLGILQSPCTPSANVEVECYKFINVASWDRKYSNLQVSRSSEQDSVWRPCFVNTLHRMTLSHDNLGDDTGRLLLTPLKPPSLGERILLCRMLPRLLWHLGEQTFLSQVLQDPLATHCRMFGSVFGNTTTQNYDPLPSCSTKANIEFQQEEILLLNSQVAWKRCCCRILSQERHEKDDACIMKSIGVALLQYPKHDDLAWRCIDMARLLQTKQLADALRRLLNALHYTAIVLWSKRGKNTMSTSTHNGEKAGLSSERRLSRRIFALQKEIECRSSSSSMQSFDFASWIALVERISLETSTMDDIDIQQGHMRLSSALEECRLAHNRLLHTCALFAADAPDLIDE